MALPFLPRASAVLADKPQWLLNRPWEQWFLALARAIDSAALGTTQPASLATQGASLPVTSLLDVGTTGLYRVQFYVRPTRAATTSSSLSVAVQWTDGGVVRTAGYPAITSNLTADYQFEFLFVRADAGTAITLETTYASVGATSMQYALDARVEAVP